MMYQITPAADSYMPRNYGELSRCLIEAVETTQAQELEVVLAEMGTVLGSSANMSGSPSMVKSYLQERGYFPDLDTRDGMIELRLANCPYLEVAEGAPSLCQFDRALIEALFGREVEMLGRIVDREPVCTFQIQN